MPRTRLGVGEEKVLLSPVILHIKPYPPKNFISHECDVVLKSRLTPVSFLKVFELAWGKGSVFIHVFIDP